MHTSLFNITRGLCTIAKLNERENRRIRKMPFEDGRENVTAMEKEKGKENGKNNLEDEFSKTASNCVFDR